MVKVTLASVAHNGKVERNALRTMLALQARYDLERLRCEKADEIAAIPAIVEEA
jgi:hypothetical protein